MTWGDRIGTVRYWQQLGDPYAQMLREALKPALGATALGAYLGLTVLKALLIGVVMVVGLLGLSLAFGWLVWRHRVIHAAIRKDWENNPVVLRQLELLEAIARNTDGHKCHAAYPWAPPLPAAVKRQLTQLHDAALHLDAERPT